MTKAQLKKSDAMTLLEKLSGGPLTLGRALESVRKSAPQSGRASSATRSRSWCGSPSRERSTPPA